MKAILGRIRITLSVLMTAFLIAFITTRLAGLYPAWKASRLEIINALRHNIERLKPYVQARLPQHLPKSFAYLTHARRYRCWGDRGYY